jgi:hypothetical protein
VDCCVERRGFKIRVRVAALRGMFLVHMDACQLVPQQACNHKPPHSSCIYFSHKNEHRAFGRRALLAFVEYGRDLQCQPVRE